MEQRHRRYNAGRANNGVADYVNIYHKQPATGNYAVAGCLFKVSWGRCFTQKNEVQNG